MLKSPDIHFDGCLGIISGTTAAIEDGKLWVNHSVGRLIEALTARSTDHRLCVPIIAKKSQSLNHALELDMARLVPLPPLQTTISAQRYYRQARKPLKEIARNSDALFVRLPFQLPNRILGLEKPKVLHVVSRPSEVIRASTDYSGLRRSGAICFAQYSEWCMKRAGRERFTRVCTNGREMWRTLNPPAGRVLVSSCMYRNEMVEKEDFALGAPPRILFVGYLRPEKGVLDLLDTFDQLRQKKAATLTLAGGRDRETSAGRLIEDRISRSAFSQDIKTVGMIEFGPDLFSLYRNHDVLVQPSLSEGTPRTLVEARSLGLPVIASNVGGIPSSVKHEEDGLLVPKGDPKALVKALLRLFSDDALRLRLIQNGLAQKERFSLEYFADQLIEEVHTAWAQSQTVSS